MRAPEAPPVIQASADEEGHPDDRWARWLWTCGVVAVLTVAAVVRVIPIRAGLPYTSYIDEGHVLLPSAHLIDDRTVDPRDYVHPSFVKGATAATALVMATLTGRGDELAEGAHRTDQNFIYDQIEPVDLLIAGRLVVLASSIGTVALTLALGRRLGGRRLGLIAALLLAVLPAAVSRSAIVLVDSPATFFVMATLLLGDRFARTRRPQLVAGAAGMTAGLAATSKYPSAAVLLALVVFIALASARSVRQRVLAGGVALGAMVTTVLVTMPALLISPRAVWNDLSRVAASYRSKGAEWPGYLETMQQPEEIGWILLAPGLAGLVLLLWNRRTRGFMFAWMAYAVPLFALAYTRQYQPLRNLLPLMPVVCLAAGVTLVAIGDLCGRVVSAAQRHPRGLSKRRPPRLVRAAVPAVAVVVMGMMLFDGGVQPYLQTQLDLVNSRVETIEWLQEHTTSADRVLVAAELRFLPGELEKVPAHTVVASAVDDGSTSHRAEDFDFVVSGPIDAPLFAWARPPGLPAATFGSPQLIPPEPNMYQPPNLPLWIRRV